MPAFVDPGKTSRGAPEDEAHGYRVGPIADIAALLPGCKQKVEVDRGAVRWCGERKRRIVNDRWWDWRMNDSPRRVKHVKDDA